MTSTTLTPLTQQTAEIIGLVFAIILIGLLITLIVFILYKSFKKDDIENEYLKTLNDEDLATIMKYKANTNIKWFKKKDSNK